MAFQLVDDALDYAADQAELGKTVGDDFREGKLTYPVILALAEANSDERAFWVRTLEESEQSEEDLATALKLIQKYDATARTIARADQFIDSAVNTLSCFSESEIRTALADVARYTTARRH